MIYSYIRVSTDKQTTENQRFEISKFLSERSLSADKWIVETVGGSKNISDRKLGVLLKKLQNGDILVVSELSRLGRKLMQIMTILNICMERNVKIISVKENYELGDNINSKVLAFAFGLSAEIERNLISARTKEALARRRAQGVKLGRPTGTGVVLFKLEKHFEDIRKLLSIGVSKSEISRKLKVSRTSLCSFVLKRNMGFD